MTDYEFYLETKKTFYDMARLKNIDISEIKRYKSYTDGDKSRPWNNPGNKLTDISLVYCQLLYHAQNGQGIGPTIQFIKNFNHIYNITDKFNPQAVSKKKAIDIYDDLTKTDKIKGNEYSKRYATTILKGAEWLKNFSDRGALITDLETKGNSNAETLIRHFRENCVKTGFGVPLAADFLKELDPKFSFLAKPDEHIIDVWAKKKGKDIKYYNSDKNKYELLKDMAECTEEINKELSKKGKKEITVYWLDRMLYIICSGKFFLHDNPTYKESFLKRI